MSDIIDNFEALLAAGQDNTLVRYSLGNAWYHEKDFEKAADHLVHALEYDPEYSAAWKIYGKVLTELNRRKEAIDAYTRGIEVAEKKGDIQAAREMKVFLKRLQKEK